MKSSEKFRDTQRVPFKIDKTRKPFFPQLGTKMFLLKNTRDFFRKMSHKAEKSERSHFGFFNIHFVARYQKTQRGTLGRY